MKEYLLTTNEYLEPKVIEGSEAYGTLLMRLFLLEPGTNPLHPGMGIGLHKYRYITEDMMPTLQTLIQDQVNTYLPSDFLTTTKAYLEISKTKYLVINIIADDTKYVFDTENSDTPIEMSNIIS